MSYEIPTNMGEPPKTEEEKRRRDIYDREKAKETYAHLNKYGYDSEKFEPVNFEGRRSYWRNAEDYDCRCAKTFTCHLCNKKLDFSYRRGYDSKEMHYLCKECAKTNKVWEISHII